MASGTSGALGTVGTAIQRGRSRIGLPRQSSVAVEYAPGLNPARRRRIALLLGLGYLLIMACWAFATPLPAEDERAQVVKAVATVRGELLGTIVHVDRTDLGLPANSGFGPGLASRYVVPRSYAGVAIPCYPAKPVHPRCSAPMSSDPSPATALSYVGNYNPIYYALVGWPSLLTLGPTSVYLMRLCTALINALLLAWTAGTVMRARDPRRALICFIAATTPMTLFIGAIVNPSGVEITSAELLWSVLLVLATDRRPLPDLLRALGIRGAVALLLLLNLRMLGPLWAAGAFATAAWVASPQRRREFVKDRWIHRAAPVFLLAGVAALLWTKLTPVELSSLRDIHPHFMKAARVTLDETPGYFKMMLFSYNWNEPLIPAFAVVVLSAALAVLLVPVLGDRRFGRPLLAILVTTVVFPILLQGCEMHRTGDVWQGRYILPLAVGALFLAGFAPVALDRPTARWLLALAGVGELTCLCWAARFNANVKGLAGSLLPLHAHWSPPVTWPGALVPFLGGLALVARLLWRLPAPDDENPAQPTG